MREVDTVTESESLDRGRELVESGASPPDMLDRLAIVDYLRSQRALVARRGCCGKHELWISPMGAVLCKHTRDPCPRQALRLVLELFSILNRGGDNGKRIGRTRRRGGYPVRR